MTVFSLALLSICYPQIHCDYSLNYKTIARYLASLKNILSRNVFKLHAKEASTSSTHYPPPPPPLDFYLSAIAAIESGRNLIVKLSSFTFYFHCEALPRVKVLIFFFVLSQVTATWRCQIPWEVTHLMFFCVWVSRGLLRQRCGMHPLRSAVADYLSLVFSSWDPWLSPFLFFI